ncbi:MAG: hypothetical protein JW724_00475 [Candidatus Altiarchaeota archaeon]|nr:hypothetical protein [Candidatus Altiarchaeota archaeon]
MKPANLFGCVNETCVETSNEHQFVEMLALGLLGFLIPFVFAGPQIVVGMLVNAFIIRSALSLPAHKALPVLFMPSIGALSRGFLFGPFTPFLAYITPFIWLGNGILFYAFKSGIRKRCNFALVLGAGALGKTAILFTAAYVLHSVSVLPAVFLTAMGTMQLVTAVLGGMIAYAHLKTQRY